MKRERGKRKRRGGEEVELGTRRKRAKGVGEAWSWAKGAGRKGEVRGGEAKMWRGRLEIDVGTWEI